MTVDVLADSNSLASQSGMRLLKHSYACLHSATHLTQLPM